MSTYNRINCYIRAIAVALAVFGAQSALIAKESGTLTKEDRKRIGAIYTAEERLQDAKDKSDTLEIEVIDKAGKPQKKTVNLIELMNNLEQELMKGKKEQQEAAQHVQQYFKEHRLYKIEKALKNAAPGKGKTLSGPLAEDWKESLEPHMKMIEQWYEQAGKPLDLGKRSSGLLDMRTGQRRGNIPKAKRKIHGLDRKNTDPWKIVKEGEKEPKAPEGVDLGKIRSSLNAVHTYVTQTKLK